MKKIIHILKIYEKNKFNNEKEKNMVIKFGRLLDNGKEKLAKLGFSSIQDTIINSNFGIHVTRIGNSMLIPQFLIRRLIRREFDACFEDKDIITYMDSLPEEIQMVIKNKILD